jgi:sugar phosphate permease
LGWPSTIRVAANWFPLFQRGKALGIIGTGYQLCGALTFVVAGWAAESFGWRAALYVPAALLAASAIHMLCVLEEAPAGGPVSEAAHARRPTTSWQENLTVTLTNPSLWLVAVCLYMLDACRYGFTDWGVKHLKEVSGTAVNLAAYKYAVLPLGGIAGAYLAGWATDRFFGSRRPPVIFLLLSALGLLSLAYDRVLHWGHGSSVVILFAIGFCIFGPQVLLVGTLPVDLARPGTAAAAAGFVNFMGYMGAATGDYLTGFISQYHGWRSAVLFWSVCAWLGAVVIAILWKTGKVRADTARPTPAAGTAARSISETNPLS